MFAGGSIAAKLQIFTVGFGARAVFHGHHNLHTESIRMSVKEVINLYVSLAAVLLFDE